VITGIVQIWEAYRKRRQVNEQRILEMNKLAEVCNNMRMQVPEICLYLYIHEKTYGLDDPEQAFVSRAPKPDIKDIKLDLSKPAQAATW
jgi:hypothetical protein